jgi:hypothetical protein
MPHLTRRFWTLAGLTFASALLLVMTLVWKEWIELIFRVDPDHGNGVAEWLIVALTGAATVIFAVSARIEWRRTETVTA